MAEQPAAPRLMAADAASPEHVVRRLLEQAFNEGDFAAVDELAAEDLELDTPLQNGPQPFRGREGFTELVRWVRSVWPDAHLTIEDLFSEGGAVAARGRFRGTQRGAFLAYPPKGRKVDRTELYMCHVVDGRVRSLRCELNVLEILQQLGEMPDEWLMGRPPQAVVAVMRTIGRTKRRLAARRRRE